MYGDGCVNLMRESFQNLYINHVVHFKYLTILFVNYTSIKLEEKDIKSLLIIIKI